MILECCDAAHDCSFLAQLCHIETNSALPLCLVKNLVSFVHGDHAFEYFIKFFRFNGVLVRLVDDFPLLVHHSETFYLLKCTLKFHLFRERVVEEIFLHFVHGSEGSLRGTQKRGGSVLRRLFDEASLEDTSEHT